MAQGWDDKAQCRSQWGVVGTPVVNWQPPDPFFFFVFVCIVSSLLCTAFSSCGERALLFVAVCGLLIMVASLVAEHGL